MNEFIDNDQGFIAWRDSHPDGYIVNAERRPKANYLMLHHATCSFMRPRNEPPNWTKDYVKFCAMDIDELIGWASRNVNGFHGLQPCGVCKP